MIQALRKVIKRLHYPIEVMLVCVRWYSAHSSNAAIDAHGVPDAAGSGPHSGRS